jgi:hypothetical protein
MPDRRRPRRRHADAALAASGRPALRPRSILPLAILVLALLTLAVAGPAIAAPRPGESCFDATAPPSGQEDVCADVNDPDVPGDAGLDLGLLLPILAAAVGGAVLALVLATVWLRRRPEAPAQPTDPGEWWTCRHCGSNNVIGSARCYSCGKWQS